MRIVVISPHFKPRPGGVSDYSFELCQQISSLGHEVVVITSSEGPFPENPFKIITVPEWNIAHVFKLSSLLKELKADQYILQWTPLAFAPRFYGIAPAVVVLLFFMRKFKMVLMAHESHYPVQFNPRGILIGLPHFIQFSLMVIILAMTQGKVVFSHKANEVNWSRFLPFNWVKKSLSTIPVFSNIPFTKISEDDPRVPVNGQRICYFGGQHPTNDLRLVREAFDYCRENGLKDLSLDIIGISKENCPDVFKGDGINLLGRLSEKELSFHLQQVDLLVIPFIDGVSTRRGTLMAGLLHGLSVASTSGWNTLGDVPWKDIVCLVPAQERKGFCKMTHQFLNDSKALVSLSKRGHHHYKGHFSSDVCAVRFLEIFS